MTHDVFGVMSNGAVVEEIKDCTCYGGLEHYPHEPHCGLTLVGFLPAEAAVDPDLEYINEEPSLSAAILWDFGSLP